MSAARRTTLLITILLVVLGSPGCLVVSLSPLYEPDGIEFDAALCGTWTNDEDRQTLELARGEWRSYDLTWRDGPQDVRGSAHLVALGDARYLDVTAEGGEDRGPFVVPVHVLARVKIEADTLSVELLDYEKLSSTSGRGALPAGRFATDERENLVLTGPTRTLRTWLAAHQSRPDLFAAPVVLTRKPLPSAPMTPSPPAPTAPPAAPAPRASSAARF